MPGALLLLDSASLWFRAFYGVPASVTAPDGTPVNAVRGFLDHVARLVRDQRPRGLVACLDADWRPAFRVAALPSYKAHRVEEASGTDTPDELAPQVPVILAVLEAVGLASLGVPGYEADDVIGTLAARGPVPVEVVTGDRDLFQVIRPGVTVLYTVEKNRAYDDAAVAERYAIPNAAAYAEFAMLRGDPSDGLPGVPGIGPKTAATLVSRWPTVGQMLTALDAGVAVPAGPRLAAARDYLLAAETVVRVATDLPIPAELDPRLPAAPADPEALVDLAERWGLDGPIGRLLSALDAVAGQH